MVELTGLAPAAVEGWWTLFELTADEPKACLMIGGQMMHLLVVEMGREPVRTTVDVDVVVNVRTRPGGTEWLSTWLADRAFEFAGASPEGIGPDGLGERTSLITTPPARTVQVPGATQAFRRSALVNVSVTGLGTDEVRSGQVRRPSLLGALVSKAVATTIPVRTNPERDWQDAAMLATLIADPRTIAEECDRKDRQRLARLRPLSDLDHHAWLGIDREARRNGAAALSFILDR